MRLFRKLLFPFSVLYGIVVYIRNRLYDGGVFKSKSYETPIISVGNLSVGGTGKTPMIEVLIALLRDTHKVAVLSRGYKRKSQGFVLANANSKVEDLGDEPFQIFSKFSEVTVAVDVDRQNGIAILERDIKPDVILLDDAFQHRKVKPGLSILLTSFNDLYASDWYLPTGNLRDSRREAERADIIIVTKNPSESEEAQHLKIKNKLNPKPNQRMLFSYLVYDTVLQGNGPLKGIADLLDKKVTLVTGIADATPLMNFLNESGISFEHLRYKDHHDFTEQDLEVIKSRSNLLTTEKDYMRLKSRLDKCNYITIKHVFFGEGMKKFQRELEDFMIPYS